MKYLIAGLGNPGHEYELTRHNIGFLVLDRLAYWLQELKIPKENLLIIVDDLALPFGTLRLRTKGSSAGHNGLKNIELVLGGQDYARLRFGIGNAYAKGQQVDFVLSNFLPQEFEALPTFMDKASEMIFSFCTTGAERTMAQFNQ